MKRRLYVVLPDMASAIQTANDTRCWPASKRPAHAFPWARVACRSARCTKANVLQKSDVRQCVVPRSRTPAGLGGMLLGVYLRLSPIGDITFGAGAFLLATLGGTAFAPGPQR